MLAALQENLPDLELQTPSHEIRKTEDCAADAQPDDQTLC